ncbi:hypothetical protein BASA83_001039 [Batrachochytrium salamandrivorans]|nr:hypothetical protein BASA83_001039 [Batrachochytrium salamandrivorans]
MKLISLAALSFLAITVSAYPGPGTPPQGAGVQGAEQSQGAGAQGAQQPQGAGVQGAQQPQGANAPDPWQDRNDRGQDPWQFPSTRAQDPWQPWGTAVHDPQQPQNTGAQNEQQVRADNGRALQEHHEQSLQDTLDEVGEEYDARKGMAEGIEDFIKVLEDEMQRLGIRLGGLDDGPEYDEVFEKYLKTSGALDKQYGYLKDMNQELKDLESTYTRTVVQLLVDADYVSAFTRIITSLDATIVKSFKAWTPRPEAADKDKLAAISSFAVKTVTTIQRSPDVKARNFFRSLLASIGGKTLEAATAEATKIRVQTPDFSISTLETVPKESLPVKKATEKEPAAPTADPPSDTAAEITPATQDDGATPTVTPIADVEMCL